MALLIWLLPRTAPNFAVLCLVRTLISYFNGFLVTSPLIADYIKSDSRGQASAYATIGALCGEGFSMAILLGGTINMELNQSYEFSAIFLASLALLLFCIIREPVIKDYQVSNATNESHDNSYSIIETGN